MKNWLQKLFCRHYWLKVRMPLVLKETGIVCVAVEKTCIKCGKKTGFGLEGM